MLVIGGKLKSTKIQKATTAYRRRPRDIKKPLRPTEGGHGMLNNKMAPLRPTEGGHGMLNNKMGLPGKNLGLMNMMPMTI